MMLNIQIVESHCKKWYTRDVLRVQHGKLAWIGAFSVLWKEGLLSILPWNWLKELSPVQGWPVQVFLYALLVTVSVWKDTEWKVLKATVQLHLNSKEAPVKGWPVVSMLEILLRHRCTHTHTAGAPKKHADFWTNFGFAHALLIPFLFMADPTKGVASCARCLSLLLMQQSPSCDPSECDEQWSWLARGVWTWGICADAVLSRTSSYELLPTYHKYCEVTLASKYLICTMENG